MIRLEKVSKRFGDRLVLKEVSCEIARGEFALLLGPSGSGKTLLLALLAGLEKPSSGRVLIGGRDMTRVTPERRPVSMVFQRHALFPHLTVFENIAFSLRAQHRPRNVVRERVSELVSLIGLNPYVHALPDVLSGGQCQRVAFARALASDADVLLFDEPLSSLDLNLKKVLTAELKRLHRLKGFTALYVTHDREEAFSLSEHVCLIENGRMSRSESLRDSSEKQEFPHGRV